MGLAISTLFQSVIGTIAGALRVGPFILGQLFSKKKIPPYDDSFQELGAAAGLQNDDKFVNFKDVYFTSKDGTRLHAVIDDGTRRKKGLRPIVMVHGFPELWISWIDQMKHFAAKGHPILALSMRGYGLSDKPNNGSLQSYHLFDNIVPDIRAAVQYVTKDAAADDKSKGLAPLLVAHDWGASIAWSYVTQGQTTKNEEIAGYVSLAIPPMECFEANMGLNQLWASLYMFFFNMPWLPEKVMLANNAWLIGRMMNATKRAVLPSWMTHTYRSNCLQNSAMTSQLNYYRCLIQMAPKPNEDDVLGPKKDGSNRKVRRLDLPVLMIRGKDDDALTDDVFVGFDRYLSNARLVALDDCSHWIQADCPNEVNMELEKLLAELS